MQVNKADEAVIREIGHAFGYYDYGTEHGLINAFPSRDAAAAFIGGYVRMAIQSGMLYTISKEGEGDMRKLMEMAFSEGNRLGVSVILDTDAKSKCDKYVHLGMELAGTRRFGEHGVLYDLIKAIPHRKKCQIPPSVIE